MLKHYEELAQISLPKSVVDILTKETGIKPDLTRTISYKIPYNSAVQVYDYREKTSRVVFEPLINYAL